MSDLTLSIILSTGTDYIDLAQILCPRADWERLQSFDETLGNVASADPYVIVAATDSGEAAGDPIALNRASAAAILPVIVARILSRAIEANHE